MTNRQHDSRGLPRTVQTEDQSAENGGTAVRGGGRREKQFVGHRSHPGKIKRRSNGRQIVCIGI